MSTRRSNFLSSSNKLTMATDWCFFIDHSSCDSMAAGRFAPNHMSAFRVGTSREGQLSVCKHKGCLNILKDTFVDRARSWLAMTGVVVNVDHIDDLSLPCRLEDTQQSEVEG